MSVIAVGPAVAIAGAGYRRWATYRQAAIAGVFVNTVFGVIKLSILLGIAIILWSRRRHPGVETNVYRPGREWVPDSQVVSRYTAADFVDDAEAGRTEVPATSGAPTAR